MLGLFASVHLARADSDEVLLSDFLLGCGIRVEVADLSDVSWVADAYKQRHRDPVSVVRPMCHTMWGEKVRPIGCPVEEEGGSPRYFLVHDVCPLNKCEKHKEMLGFWHVMFELAWLQQETWPCVHSRGATLVAVRGDRRKRPRDEGQERLDAVLQDVAGRARFCCPSRNDGRRCR